MQKLISATLLITLLVGCANGRANPLPGTAAEAVSAGATANPALVATAQADQYWRDAQATATAQQATLAANYLHVEATAQADTATAVWQSTTQAIRLKAMEQSLQATGTAQALELAALAQAATAQAQATNIALQAASTNQAATVVAQETATAFQSARQAFEVTQVESQAQREQVVTIVAYLLLAAGASLFLALMGWFLWRVTPTLVNRASVVRYGQHGNPLLLLTRNGRTVITDPLAMLQSATIIDDEAGVMAPELAPNDIQMMVAGGRLRLLIEQAHHAPGHIPQLPPETTKRGRIGPVETEKTVRHGAVPPPIVNLSTSRRFRIDNDTPSQPPAAISWHYLAGWSGPGLALGAGCQNKTIAIDLARTPHLFTAGMSGSGKTRRLLRPLVAQALMGGYQVVLMNESGADFSPFYDHPNVTIVRGSAADYMAVFGAAMEEMEGREALLRSSLVSEWGRLPPYLLDEQPPVLLALDELLALAMLLSPAEQRQFWALIAAFASRARKVGMGSVGLATDPTYRALGQGGLNYRSQCARISFRVMQAAGSRAILDESGAEALEQGQFMALLDSPGVVQGMTANPGDEELRAYLADQPAPTLPPPAWLEALDTEPEQPAGDENEAQIRELTAQGLSMRQIQREVFGYVGGAAYEMVREVQERMGTERGDTTTAQQGDTGPVPGDQ